MDTSLESDSLGAFPRDKRIHIRSVQMLYGVNLFSAAMHLAVVGLVGWVLWDANHPAEVIGWAITLGGFVLFQGNLVRRHGGEKFDPNDADRLLRLFNICALGVGISWGFAGWFLFPAGEPGRQIFLTFVMGGMAMSSVSNQHVRISTCLSSVLPGMLPLAARYFLESGSFSYVYGALLFVYTAVLVMMMFRQWRFAMMAFQLQLENEELLEDVSRQAIELDLARQSAEAANTAKSRFLAQASHDLRQPLHAISLYIEALPAAQDVRESQRILGRVRQSLDVLSRLFNSLLDVTLLDTGQIDVKPVVFRLSDLFEQVRNEFAAVAEASDMTIRIRAPALAVSADPVLLRRMLQNLTSNALRHADGGEVLLAARRRNGKAVIEIYDTGRGMPPEDLGRIFEEFTRLDPARMGGSAAPGLGLGLAIVKRLADVMGLSVGVTSEEGRGTRFQIGALPLAAMEDATRLLDENTTVEENALHGARVLFIDDDPETLAAGAELLAKWGCKVEAMADWTGPPATAPDIVVCDYELRPDFTGFDALDDLARRHGDKIPTILISGNSRPELRAEAKARGIPIIHKPVRPGQLRSALLHVTASSTKPS